MSRNLWIIIGSVAIVIVLIVTGIVLRRRSAEPTEDLVSAPLATPSARGGSASGGDLRRSTSDSSSPGLTKEEQAIKDEVQRLEATLPKDISETWSPGLRKIMEARNTRSPTITTSVTP